MARTTRNTAHVKKSDRKSDKDLREDVVKTRRQKLTRVRVNVRNYDKFITDDISG